MASGLWVVLKSSWLTMWFRRMFHGFSGGKVNQGMVRMLWVMRRMGMGLVLAVVIFYTVFYFTWLAWLIFVTFFCKIV